MTGHAEKDSSPYPLPMGEGQIDTPINRHTQGEVLTRAHRKDRFHQLLLVALLTRIFQIG